MKKIAIFTFFCAFVAIAGYAQAQPPMQPEGRSPYWGQQGVPQRPGPAVPPGQVEPSQKFNADSFGVLGPLSDALNARLEELNAQLESDRPDKGKIENLSREIGEIRGKILSARIDMRDQFRRQGVDGDFAAPSFNGPANAPNDTPRRSWHRGPHSWQGGYGRHHGGWGCPGMGMMGNW